VLTISIERPTICNNIENRTLSTGMYSVRLARPKPNNKKVKYTKDHAKLYLELALYFGSL
jgi:hypothetical protein